MGTIFRQAWRDAEVGRPISGTGCVYWSNPVKGEPDLKAWNFGRGFWAWIGKALFWRKWIVLIPEGPDNVKFSIAFRDGSGCMYSSRIRRIEDGPFRMRMGPKGCEFFAVGNLTIRLKLGGYNKGSIDSY